MLSAVTSELPNPHHPHIREIVNQERVGELFVNLGISVRKLDDVLGGLSNTICKRPQVFEREKYTGWSRILTKPFPPDVPSLRIWFTYDDDHVYIECIEALEQ
jgi:hypothetical protein